MKNVLILLLFAGFGLQSQAQVGITAGMNLAKYTYKQDPTDLTSRKALMSYNVGIHYHQAISEKWFVLPELSYTTKGARNYPSYPIGYTGPMKYLNRLNYVQLAAPVMLSVPLTDGLDDNATTFEIGGGPYIGVLTKATLTSVEFDDSKSTQQYKIGNKSSDGFKRTDYGLQFITGTRIFSKIGVHFRYEFGLNNIEPNTANKQIKNRNASLNVSWLF
jgi:hypothetical protein